MLTDLFKTSYVIISIEQHWTLAEILQKHNTYVQENQMACVLLFVA
jgi:hypothetical protein